MSSSTYLMNDIPRGVSSEDLISFLGTLVNGCALSDFQPDKSSANITDSRLDDELSVAIIQFHNTPRWFKNRDSDPYGFPKKTKLGTIWKGIDMGKKDEDGRTAFIRAVIDGNLTLAETLAEYEATDVNAKDNEGMTALHWACREGLTDLTDFCLSIPGLDISLKSNAGLRAFDIAYREALRDDNDTIPTLFYKNMFEMDEYDPDNALSRLLTLAAELGGSTKFPQEALFNPVRNGNLALVQALIKRITVTSPLALNGDGDTVLHVAARVGHLQIVVLLIEAGFDVNATARDGYTVLHYASQYGHIELIREILLRGANIDAVERHGRTALHLAAHYGLNLTVQLLLELGANWDSKDHEGKTALQMAINNGLETSKETADLLRSWRCEIGVEYSQTLVQATAEATIHPNMIVLEPQYSGGLSIPNLQSPHPSRDQPMFTQHSLQESSITQTSHEKINLSPSPPPSPSGSSTTQTSSSHNTSTTTDEKEEVRMSKLLSERGGAIEGRDEGGRTALHMAIFQQDMAVVSLLLDHGADIQAGYWAWMSPLEIAERKRNRELVKLLLERGARMMEDPDTRTTDSLAASQVLSPETDKGADEEDNLDSVEHIVNRQEYEANIAVQLGQGNITEQPEHIVNRQEYEANISVHMGQENITEQLVDGLAGLGLKLDSLTQKGILPPPESNRELEANNGRVTTQGQDYFNVHQVLSMQEAVSGITAPMVFELPPSPTPEYDEYKGSESPKFDQEADNYTSPKWPLSRSSTPDYGRYQRAASPIYNLEDDNDMSPKWPLSRSSTPGYREYEGRQSPMYHQSFEDDNYR